MWMNQLFEQITEFDGNAKKCGLLKPWPVQWRCNAATVTRIVQHFKKYSYTLYFCQEFNERINTTLIALYNYKATVKPAAS